jgi:hypothetical protein
MSLGDAAGQDPRGVGMNKILAETLSILNGVFSVVLIIAGGVAGVYLGPFYAPLLVSEDVLGNGTHAELIGGVCGIAIGFFSAVMLCGLVALLVQMHRELKTIRTLLQEYPPAPLNREGSRSRVVMPEVSSESRETTGSSSSGPEVR